MLPAQCGIPPAAPQVKRGRLLRPARKCAAVDYSLALPAAPCCILPLPVCVPRECTMSRPTLRLFDGYDHTSPELRRDVRELQRRLHKHGLPVGVDGFFGRETEAAVMRFQSEHGLASDGIAGPRTWAVLLGTRLAETCETFETTCTRDDSNLLPHLA